MAIPETIGTSDVPPVSSTTATRSAISVRDVRLAALPWRWAALGMILFAACALNIWQLDRGGGNGMQLYACKG